jgi:ACS family allantoate permease-like MFS transporter
VILGSVTMGFGLLMLWKFPDSPMKGSFLTEREKEIAVMRVQKNNTGMQTRKFKKTQFLEAFKDLQLYIISFTAFSFAFANGALGRYVAFFTPVIDLLLLIGGFQFRRTLGYFFWLFK